MLSSQDVKGIAEMLRESKILGLFADDNAHKIVTRELGLKLEEHNLFFDMNEFERIAGVVPNKPE